MINLQDIFQKPILRSQFLGLALMSLAIMAVHPSAVQAQWTGPNTNNLTTENNVGIGPLAQPSSNRPLLVRRDQSGEPSEIVI